VQEATIKFVFLISEKAKLQNRLREYSEDLFDIASLKRHDSGAEAFLSAFLRLADNPGLGHRREDLTPKPYFFYTIHPYLIVYARESDPLPILGVLHGSRDVQRILRRP
jgi:plasmid stabilization system protein ParE